MLGELSSSPLPNPLRSSKLTRRSQFRSDVDIYLYNANTEDIATSWRGVQNARGMIGIVPDEEWWPEQSASEWFNRESNVTIPYFFVIVDGGDELTGGETHQSTFTVIRKHLFLDLCQVSCENSSKSLLRNGCTNFIILLPSPLDRFITILRLFHLFPIRRIRLFPLLSPLEFFQPLLLRNLNILFLSRNKRSWRASTLIR